MTFKRAVVLGMFVAGTLAGCATGTSPVAVGTSDGGSAGHASPVLAVDPGENCAHYGGWYDSVAGACDDNAP